MNNFQKASDLYLTKPVPDNWAEMIRTGQIEYVDDHITEALEYVDTNWVVDAINSAADMIEKTSVTKGDVAGSGKKYPVLFGTEDTIIAFNERCIDGFIEHVLFKELLFFVDCFTDKTSPYEVLNSADGLHAQAISMDEYKKIRVYGNIGFLLNSKGRKNELCNRGVDHDCN